MDAFLDEQTGRGRLDSRGAFSLNAGLLEDRFGIFQRQRPLYYLIRLVQGMLALRPESLKISLTRRSLRLHAVRTVYEARVHPLEAWMDGSTALSQGLLTWFLGPVKAVTLSDHEHSVNLSTEGWTQSDGGRLDRRDFAVELFWKWGLGPLGYLFGNARNRAACHRLLVEAFAFAGVPIVFDGRLLNGWPPSSSHLPCYLVERQIVDREGDPGGLVWGGGLSACRPALVSLDGGLAKEVWVAPLAHLPADEDRYCTLLSRLDEQGEVLKIVDGQVACRAVIRLRRTMELESHLHFVKSGFWVESLIVRIECPGLEAICSAEGLASDVSGLALVRNDAWDQRLDWLRQQAKEAYASYHGLAELQKPKSYLPFKTLEVERAEKAYGLWKW